MFNCYIYQDVRICYLDCGGFIALVWFTGLSRKDGTSNSTFVVSEEVKKTVSGKQGNVSSRYFWLLYLV